MMQTTLFWIPGPWAGRLAIMLRPRGGDWLADEVQAWSHARIDRVVSLLERDEEAQLELGSEAEAAASCGVEFTSFPIPDRGIPPSQESAADLIRSIMETLARGGTVAVHCRQGVGRSALIAAAALVGEGREATEAIDVIRTSRGVDVPETDQQRAWLRIFASRFAGTLAAQDRAAL